MKSSVAKSLSPQGLLSCFLLVFFFVLALLFPYTCDDWAWGSAEGLERLGVWFQGYNGRYLGNLLVMALTRSKPLCAAVMALCHVACLRFVCRYAGRRDAGFLALAAVLFFLMPSGIFQQAVVWTSGFSNYVPSVLCSLILLVLLRDIFTDEPPRFPVRYGPIVFLISSTSALFVENITLFHLCLAIILIVYSHFRFHRVFPVLLWFLAGSLLGCGIMFSNSAYGMIFTGTDSYRELATNTGTSLVPFLINKLYELCDNLVLENFLLCGLITSLLGLLTARAPSLPSRCAFFANAACCALVALYALACRVPALEGAAAAFSHILRICLSLAYLVTLLATAVLVIPRQDRMVCLLPLLCIPLLVAPLLVVSPVGPRCFFGAWLLMAAFALKLVTLILTDHEFPVRLNRSALAGMVLLAAMYLAIFIPIHRFDSQRNALVHAQVQAGQETVLLTQFPSAVYVWSGEPGVEPWGASYKSFHDLPDSTVFVYVDSGAYADLLTQYLK